MHALLTFAVLLAGQLVTSHSLKPPGAFYSHLLQFEYIFLYLLQEIAGSKVLHLVSWLPIGESHWFVSLQFMMRQLRTVHQSSEWTYRHGSVPLIALPENLVVLFQGGWLFLCAFFVWLVGFNPQNLPRQFLSAFFTVVSDGTASQYSYIFNIKMHFSESTEWWSK